MRFWGRFFGITIASLLVASAAVAMTQKPMTAEKAPPIKRAIANRGRTTPNFTFSYWQRAAHFYGQKNYISISEDNIILTVREVGYGDGNLYTFKIGRSGAKSAGFDNFGDLFSVLTKPKGINVSCESKSVNGDKNGDKLNVCERLYLEYNYTYHN
jgi:hypothetical protein